MIHDSLGSSAAKYEALHPLFPQLFEYLDSHLDEMADSAFDGKHVIQGDDLFVMVGTHALKRPEEAALEAHDRYIDVQVVIAGAESFGWAQRAACTEPRGEFVIFFPEDAHAPLIRPEGVSGGCRKAIFKVKVAGK